MVWWNARSLGASARTARNATRDRKARAIRTMWIGPTFAR